MESKPQLFAKLWRPVLRKFSSTVERACLRRDAYLDHVFAHEAGVLKDELPCPNSPAARAYLRGKLEELDRVPVNFSLSPATIEAVNRACEELNVIRDCFINRVLFLLSADMKTCEAVIDIKFRDYLGEILGEHDRDFLYAPLFGGGLDAVSEIVSSDPFWALRNAMDHAREKRQEEVEPLHACVILPQLFKDNPPGAITLNCYLPDAYVPEPPAAKKALEELLEICESMTENPRDLKPASKGRNAE